jgi:phospholipase/carboxylesterase
MAGSGPLSKVLETFEHQTGPDPAVSVIWLHGLGADAHDFEPAVPALALDSERPIRFIFPNAPARPVTINGGAVMRAWYDITGFGPEATEDSHGIRSSQTAIEQLIARETQRGIASERIVLAGFSQGGALALFTALRHSTTLAGVVALSTYLPLQATLHDEAAGANSKTPIFMAHGIADPIVPIDLAQLSRACLDKAGYSVDWRTYPVAHGVLPDELADVRLFLDALCQ